MALDQFYHLMYRSVIQELGDEIPRREITSVKREAASARLNDRVLLDALCRHREILRRETKFLGTEVTSRGFATYAGKRDYLASQSNGREISPFAKQISALFNFRLKGVNLPYLVSNQEEPLDFLLHESQHLAYRIESLVSVLKNSSISVSSEKVKMLLFLMSRAAVKITKIIRMYCYKHATSPELLHRVHWESMWGSPIASRGVFDDITTLSPMQFTPSTPGIRSYSATIGRALQIYSLKIVELNPNLSWPLRVYGAVAARDTVDRNRNILFYRSRDNCQEVTEEDPFLRLTGPSRAIVAVNPLTFEAQLKIRCAGAEPKDRALLTCIYNYRSVQDTTPLLRGYCCSAKLSLEQLPRAIQATIVGVRLVEGGWPFKYGCRVYCSLSSAQDPTPREVVLLDCGYDDESPIGSDGYFCLARNVISAQPKSKLKVVIEPHSRPRHKLPKGQIEFPVQKCQTSKGECEVGDSKVDVVIAWSLIVMDKLDLMLEG